ncbi:GAF and ANTAR domain-containing protein [Streptomyces boninensis]|uniref:GAF and ANTAR domain-containing protein n=1 Tax=Streptomyces boninensis TaxID=2039455 RepID=UPI003B20D0C4
MSGPGRHEDAALTAMRRASAARARAARDLRAAERNERIDDGRLDTSVYAETAAAHRRSAACHLAAARLHLSFAGKLLDSSGGAAVRPHFMAEVADLFGTSSAALTLIGTDLSQLSFAASDPRARAAQDLEYILGDGPVKAVTGSGTTTSAAGSELEVRWPGYGAGLAALGVHEVVAVPLRSAGHCLGALSVYDPLTPAGRYDEVAAALTNLLLGADADPELYGGLDHQDVVHQATGMVAEQQGCTVNDALSIIKARAFADGESVRLVAERIVHGKMRLG